jgi:hypothetical protein
MVVGMLNQGFKKSFAFERLKDNVLKFKVIWEFKCSFTNMSYSSCKWIAIRTQQAFFSHIVCHTFQVCRIYNYMHLEFFFNDIWNKQIKKGLTLKVKPKIK